MKDYTTYVNEQEQQLDEGLLTNIFKKTGVILLYASLPYLISLGVRVTTNQMDRWVRKIIEKWPRLGNSIDTLSRILKDNFDDCNKCKDLVNGFYSMRLSKIDDFNIYKDEILNHISDTGDREKVAKLLDFINTNRFKDELLKLK